MVRRGKQLKASRLDRPLAEGVRVGEKPSLSELKFQLVDTGSASAAGIAVLIQLFRYNSLTECLQIMSVASLIAAMIFLLHQKILHRRPQLYIAIVIVVEALLLVLDRTWLPGEFLYLNGAVALASLGPFYALSIVETVNRIRTLTKLVR